MIIIEWQDKEYKITDADIFPILERWEDEVGLTTIELFSWATQSEKPKPVKAAKAFGVVLSQAGGGDVDEFELLKGLHNSNLQESLMTALYTVAGKVIPPSDFIQEDDTKKKVSESKGA